MCRFKIRRLEEYRLKICMLTICRLAKIQASEYRLRGTDFKIQAPKCRPGIYGLERYRLRNTGTQYTDSKLRPKRYRLRNGGSKSTGSKDTGSKDTAFRWAWISACLGTAKARDFYKRKCS